jgi:hypothetical protein
VHTVKLLSLLVISGTLSLTFAGDPSIGFAVAPGGLQINNSRVTGNPTLFEGASLRIGSAISDLVLSNGARLRLAPESEARIYRDHLVLSGGHAQLAASASFSVDTLGMRVRPDSPGASVDVAVRNRSLVEVAAVRGDALITRHDGALIARVPAGSALSLEPQAAGAAAPMQISGILRLAEGIYTITDTVSNVTFLLSGSDLDRFVNQCVNVTGSVTPTTGGMPATLRVLSMSACGKPAAGAPQGKHISARTKVLIAGVAIGATAATIGIAAGRENEKPNASRDK